MKIIKHYLGSYNNNTRKQCCVICGKEILNHNNTMVAPSEDGTFPMLPKWPEGEFYEAGKNPTVMFTELSDDYMQDGDVLINCNEE